MGEEVEELGLRCQCMAISAGGMIADARKCPACSARKLISDLRASLTRAEAERERILGLLKEERSVANADLERFIEIGDKWSARFMEGGRDICDEVLRQIALGNQPIGLSRAKDDADPKSI